MGEERFVGEEPPRFFGDYEILGEIARGGMGVVCRARQLSLNRPVALKFIAAGPLASRGFVERFQLEAEAAARLHHPNIVPVYEVGEHHGRHFISMKLLEGGTLADRIPKVWDRLSILEHEREVVEILRRVALAVQHAHQRGILHRDLKPANILFDQDDQPYVVDFGLAKLAAEDSGLTVTGSFLGTPAYMAPEQAGEGARGAITTAADVYSLGAVLYHMLAGQPPFAGASVMETMRQVVEREPPSPGDVRTGLSKDLETICLKCLEKDPGKRYASAGELADDLARWQGGESVLARPTGAGEKLWRWCRRKPGLAALSGAVLVLLATVTVVSIVAAWRIERALGKAVAAEQQATRELWAAELARARAGHWSGRAGRRFDSLQALSHAATIRPAYELRKEAIDCLSLADLRPEPKRFRATDGNGKEKILLDRARQRYTLSDTAGNIKICRWPGGEMMKAVPALASPMLGLPVLSANGRWIATWHGNDHGVIRDLETLGITRDEEVGSPWMSFDPGGDRVLYTTEADQPAVGLARGGERKVFETGMTIGFTSWSPDGRSIAALGATNRWVLFFDAEDGGVLARWECPARTMGLVWHPDGRQAVVLAHDTLLYRIWFPDRKHVEVLTPMAGHYGTPTSAAFTHDGRLLVSVGWDGQARLWDYSAGKELVSVNAGSELVEVSPGDDDVAVYGGGLSEVSFYELAAGREVLALTDSMGGRGRNEFDTVGFGPDGKWLVVNFGGGLEFWDPVEGRRVGRTPGLGLRRAVVGRGGGVLVGWDADGFLGMDAGRARVGDVSEFVNRWPVLEELGGGGRNEWQPLRGSISDDGKLFAVVMHTNQCAVVCDVGTGRFVARTGVQPGMKYAALSVDGRWLATGAWHAPNVQIWEARTGRAVRSLSTDDMANVAFSPDGRWVVSGSGSVYQFWRVGDWGRGHEVRRPFGDDFPGEMSFSGDGRVMAVTYARQNARLVRVADGETLAEFNPTPAVGIVALALSPDAAYLAMTRADGTPQIWNLRSIRGQLGKMGLGW